MIEHKALIMGQIHREHFSYRSGWGYYSEIEKTLVLDRFEKIWEGNISSNKLVKGDHIYINELNMRVNIINRIVSTDGTVTYETDYVIKTEENNKTIESLKLAKIKSKIDNDHRKETELTMEKMKREVEVEQSLIEYFRGGCATTKSWVETL